MKQSPPYPSLELGRPGLSSQHSTYAAEVQQLLLWKPAGLDILCHIDLIRYNRLICMVIPPTNRPQFWQLWQLSGLQLAQAFGKQLEIP